MAKQMEEYTDHVEVLPNLINTEIFKKERKKIKELRIVTVSALRQGKRIDDIIKALKIILETKKELNPKLTIVGDGYLEEVYKNKCQELGMDSYVDFVGRKSKEEISKILQDHNIFVIASEKETFCIPGVEALASGMPVVSTNCLGPAEYLDEKSGKLVEVGNVKAIADAIIEVYENIDQYDPKYLRKKANSYSGEKVSKKAIELYKEMLKK